MIHAGFVDEPVEDRKAYLSDEIRRAMDTVAPAEKSSYLEALAEHFPDWQITSPVLTDEVVPVPVSEVVNQLLNRLAELSATDRERLEATFSTGPVNGAFDDSHLDLWKKLSLDAGSSPSTERTWRLLGSLIEFFAALDQLGWTLWRSMGVKSAFWKEAEFSKMVGPYLAGDSEVSTDHVRQTVERTRRLVAAIIGAPGKAAADVANAQSAGLSPDAIEVAARSEKRTLESLDAACWREYKSRYAAHYTASHVEAAIQQAVAHAAEDLIGGRTR